MEQFKIIETIRKRILKEHPEITKDVKKYYELLSKELKSAGVDPTKINLESLTDSATDLSVMLDEKVFHPYFSRQAGPAENAVLEALIMFGHSKKIEETLTVPKLFFASMSVLLLLASLSKLKRNPLYSIVYFFGAADCLRISYNCYTKNYYSLAVKKHTSNPGTMVSSFVAWAQKAVGAAVVDDPLKKLKEEVSWEILLEETWGKYLYHKVARFLAENVKR